MKKKLLTTINSLIAMLLSALGLSSCIFGAMYGVPHATFELSGTVTDEAEQPLKDIQVGLRRRGDGYPGVVGYTDENGRYEWTVGDFFPVDSIDIIVSDTNGVYMRDSVRVGIEYDSRGKRWGDSWNHGTGTVQQDFRLKKK